MRIRLEKLGYRLDKRQTDAFGRKWEFRTSPIIGGGPTNYFHNLKDVDRYVKQVEQVREWQR